MSTVVGRLVEGGLVTRQAAPDDARRVRLAVTPRARRLLRDAPPSAQARLVAAARALPPAQLAHLGEALGAWRDGFLRTGRDGVGARAAARRRAAREAVKS
jgi:DNA-binding MarR family transcriptional regulator